MKRIRHQSIQMLTGTGSITTTTMVSSWEVVRHRKQMSGSKEGDTQGIVVE